MQARASARLRQSAQAALLASLIFRPSQRRPPSAAGPRPELARDESVESVERGSAPSLPAVSLSNPPKWPALSRSNGPALSLSKGFTIVEVMMAAVILVV